MYSKNIMRGFIVGMLAGLGLVLQAQELSEGSLLVYNNSHYKINIIITVKQEGGLTYVQQVINPAPKNADGSLQVHPVNEVYIQDSHVPLGNVYNVKFTGPAQDFHMQIYNDKGDIIHQLNIGASIDTVTDVDTDRAVYIYSIDNKPNTGGAVFFWNKKHPLHDPHVQEFSAQSSI